MDEFSEDGVEVLANVSLGEGRLWCLHRDAIK